VKYANLLYFMGVLTSARAKRPGIKKANRG
jgi:hypothetical protein